MYKHLDAEFIAEIDRQANTLDENSNSDEDWRSYAEQREDEISMLIAEQEIDAEYSPYFVVLMSAKNMRACEDVCAVFDRLLPRGETFQNFYGSFDPLWYAENI